MLKEKRILEGQNIRGLLVGRDLEELTVSNIKNKKDLSTLIEELKQLKVVLEKESPSNQTETQKKEKPKNKTSKNYGVKLVSNTETKSKNKTKKILIPDEIKSELNKIFPDQVVNISDLRVKHISLYSKLTKFAKMSSISPKELLLKNGYGYLRKERNKISNWSEEEYHSLLEKTYPQKEISAKDFRIEQDGLFYNLALSYSRKQKMNIEQYLESLGYDYVKKRLKAS